jgi:hypothetical protein
MVFLIHYVISCLLIISYGVRVNHVFFLLYISFAWSIAFALRAPDAGLDIITYYNIFLDPGYYQIREVGLSNVNESLKIFSSSLIWFNFSYATIMLVFIGIFFVLHTKHFVVAFVLFSSYYLFYQFHLNIYRQSLAVVIGLSVINLAYRSSNKFLVLMILPMSLHYASVVLLINYVVSFIKVRRWMILFFIMFSLIPISANFLRELVRFASVLVPALGVPFEEYMRLNASGVIAAATLDHKNLPVFMATALIYRRFGFFTSTINLKLLTSVTISSLFLASLVKGNVLLYDRFLIVPQLTSIVIITEYLNEFVRVNRLALILIIILSSVLFTVFIWGPRNLLGNYALSL